MRGLRNCEYQSGCKTLKSPTIIKRDEQKQVMKIGMAKAKPISGGAKNLTPKIKT